MHDKLDTQRSILMAVIAIVVTCGAVGAFVVLTGQWGRQIDEIVSTTVTVGVASLFMLISVAAWIRRRWFPLGPIACVMNLAALAMLMFVIWRPPRLWAGLDYFEFVMAFSFFSSGLTHACLLALADLRPEYRWVRRATVVSAASVVALVVGASVGGATGSAWEQCSGIAAIVMVCGTIAVGILHRLSRIKNQQNTRTFEFSVSLVCPRCATTTEIAVGHSRCSSCGLRFNLEIDEDQCGACGYPLYKLTSDRCPECGAKV